MTPSRNLVRHFLALLLPILLMPAARALEMVSVDRTEINMRTGAGTDHASMWLLSRGYPLIVTERKGKWLKVKDFENDEGWVYGPLTADKPHFVVKSTSANIRSGPGTRYRVVGKAAYGEVLRRLERQAKWAKVRTAEGLTGWVSRALLWGW
jgi:SH3-like domain-containing protein